MRGKITKNNPKNNGISATNTHILSRSPKNAMPHKIPVKGVMGTILTVGAGAVGGVVGGQLANKLTEGF